MSAFALVPDRSQLSRAPLPNSSELHPAVLLGRRNFRLSNVMGPVRPSSHVFRPFLPFHTGRPLAGIPSGKWFAEMVVEKSNGGEMFVPGVGFWWNKMEMVERIDYWPIHPNHFKATLQKFPAQESKKAPSSRDCLPLSETIRKNGAQELGNGRWSMASRTGWRRRGIMIRPRSWFAPEVFCFGFFFFLSRGLDSWLWSAKT